MEAMERNRWALPLSSRSPAAPGGPFFELTVEADVVVDAEVIPGRLHRGAEKLFESRDYRSLLALANRHDWLGSFSSELGLAQLIERFLGIEVPGRARWLRTLLAEYSRIAHHLLWLSSGLEQAPQTSAPAAYPDDPRTLVTVGYQARQRVLDVVEAYCGTRMHPMAVTIGGMRADYAPGWLSQVQRSLDEIAAATASLRHVYDAEAAWLEGLAVLPWDAAWRYSASGPVARASGMGFDLRLDDPDDCYAELAAEGALRRVTFTAGDAQARMLVLVEQLEVSMQCVRACVERLQHMDSTAPVNVTLPRSLRVPEGQGYAETENPAGLNGWYLVSRGGTHPYRLKLRTASYNNAQSLGAALPGTSLQLMPAAVHSFFLLAGDTDK